MHPPVKESHWFPDNEIEILVMEDGRLCVNYGHGGATIIDRSIPGSDKLIDKVSAWLIAEQHQLINQAVELGEIQRTWGKLVEESSSS